MVYIALLLVLHRVKRLLPLSHLRTLQFRITNSRMSLASIYLLTCIALRSIGTQGRVLKDDVVPVAKSGRGWPRLGENIQ